MEARQMHLTEQDGFYDRSFISKFALHQAVVNEEDFYREHSPEQYKQSCDFIAFWGSISQAVVHIDDI